MLIDTIPQKRCSRCKQYLPAGCFADSKSSKDGLQNFCRKCCAENKGRVWHPICIMPDGYRQCGHCKRVLPLDTFSKNKNCRGGVSNKCKECSKEYDTQYLNEHREENKQRSRQRHIDKPEYYVQYELDHVEDRQRWRREWRKANPEKVKKHKADSAKRHPESHKRRMDRYNNKYPHIQRMRIRVQTMRRRARMDLDRSVLLELYEEQEHRCAYCGISVFWEIPNDIHIDHIKPLSRGGTNEKTNLNIACEACNLSKHDLDLSDWQQVRGW